MSLDIDMDDVWLMVKHMFQWYESKSQSAATLSFSETAPTA